jgi:hypothetical protein
MRNIATALRVRGKQRRICSPQEGIKLFAANCTQPLFFTYRLDSAIRYWAVNGTMPQVVDAIVR